MGFQRFWSQPLLYFTASDGAGGLGGLVCLLMDLVGLEPGVSQSVALTLHSCCSTSEVGEAFAVNGSAQPEAPFLTLPSICVLLG